MALVDWASAEPYTEKGDLAARTEWSVTAFNLEAGNSTRSIFGFPGEKWFNLGSTTEYDSIRRVFTAPLKEGEFSASINISEGASVNIVPDIGLHYTLMGIRRDDNNNAGRFETSVSNYPGVIISRRSEIDGEKLYLVVRGASAVFEGVLPNIELVAGALYYLTVRWRDSTGAGNDGIVEVWSNNVLLWSDNTVDFAGVDMTAQSVVLGPAQFCQTYARNLTIHNEWTTGVGVAPKHKNVYEVTDLNVISSTDYTLEGPAGTISEAMTDDLISSLISTITPNAIAEFGIASIPAIFSTNDVVDIGTRVQAAREPNGYASPTISLKEDTGTITYGAVTTPILAVGDARTEITVTGAVTAPITMDKVRIVIDSGA